ncbi:unnamed protein product, partial [Symbiodinium sp. CCMP2456]
MSPPLRVPAPTCGKILLRCKTHAAAFREHIGVQVCVFKIGVTANVPRRFSAYLNLGFTAMWILHTGDEVGLIHMLEAALIAEFQNCTGCRNSANTGGEGALNRKVREGPPFFVYITGGRADQARRAACKHVVEIAKATLLESPDGHTPALREFAAVSENDAEEGAHRIFRKYGLAAPLRVQSINIGPGPLQKFPFLNFSDWVRYLLDRGQLGQLCGTNDIAKMNVLLGEFWRRYRLVEPDYELWRLADSGQLENVPTPQDIREDGMRLNFEGNTWSNQFLVSVMTRALQNRQAGSMEKIVASFAKDMCKLATEGVTSKDKSIRIWCAQISTKGDLPALIRLGNLERNYARCPKQSSSKKACIGICHLCLAGCEGANNRSLHPWEDFGPAASWRQTEFQMVPWEDEPKIITGIPVIRGAAEAFFAIDVWHTFHYGIAKYFLGSAMVEVIAQFFDDRSWDAKFHRLGTMYVSFCRANRLTPYITEVTKDTFSFESEKSSVVAHWSKGAVSSNMMLFLADLLQRFVVGQTEDEMFLSIVRATTAMNWFFSQLYAEGFWIRSEKGLKLAQMVQIFLLAYQKCAWLCARMQKNRFRLVPKLHMLSHVGKRIEDDAGRSP